MEGDITMPGRDRENRPIETIEPYYGYFQPMQGNDPDIHTGDADDVLILGNGGAQKKCHYF
jgi:hypothetical protein